jgi:membrane fusion protein
MSSLFRSEAVDHTSRRLAGDVLLATPVTWRVYTALAAVVVVGAVVFLARASYAREETVIGWLVPRGGIIRVAARQGGTIDALLVKENDIVRAGQPIARVGLSTALAGGGNAGAAVAAALMSEARADAAAAGASRDKLLAERADLMPKRADLAAQRTEIERQIALQQVQVGLAATDLKRFEILAAGGNLAVRQVDQARAALLSAQQSLSQLRAGAAGVAQQLNDVDARLHAIPADLADAEASARSAASQIAQKQIAAGAQNTDILVAPIGGRVIAIPVEAGQPLAPSATVAIIVPAGARLEAELYAPSRAVGFIAPGQAVRMMYQAFPHEKFGAASGIVASVSSTILSPSEVAIPGVDTKEPMFRIRAAIAAQAVRAYGRAVPLRPGMLLSADIVFDRRTLFEWLLDPIYAERR